MQMRIRGASERGWLECSEGSLRILHLSQALLPANCLNSNATFRAGTHMNILLAGTMAIVLEAAGQPVIAADTSNGGGIHDSDNALPAPGFDCARAKSHVERVICATPELAKLDAQLGDIFLNMSGQTGLDARALRRDEDRWLLKVRGACSDVACLEIAYQKRIGTLKDRSLQTASPVAYAETRPFPAEPSLLANARSFLGKSCDLLLQPSNASASGYLPVKGFLPVVTATASVQAFAKERSRFAFLMANSADGQCRIRDVVALPDPSIANALLQCDSPESDDSAMTGIGMRLVGDRKVVAYWSIDTQANKLDRLPLGVLGVENTMRCREPETGE
jgi:uncharacterized protein YecT (DUF1311 family)